MQTLPYWKVDQHRDLWHDYNSEDELDNLQDYVTVWNSMLFLHSQKTFNSRLLPMLLIWRETTWKIDWIHVRFQFFLISFQLKILVHLLICFLSIRVFWLNVSQEMSQIICRNNVSGYKNVLILLQVTTRNLLFTLQIGQLVTNKQNIWPLSMLCRNNYLQFKGIQIRLSYFKLTNEWKVRYKN